ncbi:MAG: NAD(P)-dependent oxidoreductase [Pseudomonadota bacterium]|nr:NAD(P)-dependent oxidoreductase [Pseudomonadota bacterium]
MPSNEVIGFIGLGVMGGPMCGHIARKGDNRVIGHDVDMSMVEAWAGDGVEAGTALSDVASAADIIFMSLPGEPQIRAVCEGPEGLVALSRAGQLIVDCSTAPVTMTHEIAAAFEEKGVKFVDAPVTRSAQAARDGTLSFMVGGAAEDIERARPYFDRMGQDVNHGGPVGAGQFLKLMNNMLVARITHALGEALVCARESGLVDGETLFEAMATGSADSFVLRNHGLKFMAKDHHPTESFRISYLLKDLNYAIEVAESCGVIMEGAYTNREVLERADKMGFGEKYHTVIAEAIERGRNK